MSSSIKVTRGDATYEMSEDPAAEKAGDYAVSDQAAFGKDDHDAVQAVAKAVNDLFDRAEENAAVRVEMARVLAEETAGVDDLDSDPAKEARATVKKTAADQKAANEAAAPAKGDDSSKTSTQTGL